MEVLNETIAGFFEMQFKQLDHLARQIDIVAADKQRIANSSCPVVEVIPNEVTLNIQYVEAALKIAASHTKHVVWDGKVRPFDKSKLVILQVKIDPNTEDDSAATELFNEASGQLKYLNSEVARIKENVAQQQQAYRLDCEKQLKKASDKINDLIKQYETVLHSEGFTKLLLNCDMAQRSCRLTASTGLLLGYLNSTLPLPSSAKTCPSIGTAFSHIFGQIEATCFNQKTATLHLPLIVDLDKGGAILIRNKPNQADIGKIIQDMLLRAIRISVQTTKSLQSVSYVDPDIPSSISLGPLAEFSFGDEPLIRNLPLSPSAIEQYFRSLESEAEEMEGSYISGTLEHGINYILVFRAFPYAYSSREIALINKLIAVARAYHLFVIVDGIFENKRSDHNDAVEKALLNSLALEEGMSPILPSGALCPESSFEWISPIEDKSATLQIIRNCLGSRTVNEDNNFVSRASEALTAPIKGSRVLDHLPIGVDKNGQITYLSFEDEKFAAFVCGASRSGKSTFLHTLLSDVFVTKHPDDVEVWLVDFKMMEFSRYIDSVPPHVRYIVLDESPELVYDLIDRLYDVLHKRQAIFKKNGWTSLKDAQEAGKYMPALLVVIDEFSVMSKIVANSTSLGMDSSFKLQELLAKGGGTGFRFVFSSQGFTTGAQGLTALAKKQIQQRIAMKTEYAEIKETLEINRASEKDRRLMEGLAPHYALLRTERGEAGDTLIQKTHVLFFKDAVEQRSFLNPRLKKYVPEDRYQPENKTAYVNKQPQVFDGNNFTEFSDVHTEASSIISKKKSEAYDTSTIYIHLGEPRRLIRFLPIELVTGFAENILLQVPNSQGKAFQSMLVTIAESLDIQGIQLQVIVGRNTLLLPQSLIDVIPNTHFFFGEQGVREFLSSEANTSENVPRFTVLLELESLFNRGDLVTKGLVQAEAQVTLEKRATGENDLITDLMSGNLEPPANSEVSDDEKLLAQAAKIAHTAQIKLDYSSKIKENHDISLLGCLEHGSNVGSHFMFVTQRASELKRYRISLDWFRHRVAFRMAYADATAFVALRNDAKVISELTESCFRYSDGIKDHSATFRPYAHSSIGIFAEEDIDEDTYLL